MKNGKKNNDGIIVLCRTEPGMCGGTDATLDTKAPKSIDSDEMVLFNVTSALHPTDTDAGKGGAKAEPISFISAFAAKTAKGVFVFLETSRYRGGRNGSDKAWALVKDDFFPELVRIVREHDLAKDNGFHSQTHGLPENFGGSADIRYASGETISFSNNQRPVISFEAGTETARVFAKALKAKKVTLPDPSELKAVKYEENRSKGGFTKATLTLNADGTAVNAKQSRYDDGYVYETEKPVSKDTVDKLKEVIRNTGIFAWSDLPSNNYSFLGDKKLIFVFEDGKEITVKNDRVLPYHISDGFFAFELEMTTKH